MTQAIEAYSDLTVILPTLNEAGNIAGLCAALEKVLPGVSLIVVDDASSDGTPDVVRRDAPRARLIERRGSPR
jgi:dolichol-phosphate mannosyltransferase